MVRSIWAEKAGTIILASSHQQSDVGIAGTSGRIKYSGILDYYQL